MFNEYSGEDCESYKMLMNQNIPFPVKEYLGKMNLFWFWACIITYDKWRSGKF